MLFLSVEKSRISIASNSGAKRGGGRGRPRGGGQKARGLKKEAQPENHCPTVRPTPRKKEPVMEGSAKEEKEEGNG
jgi:hypothetical protein